MRIVLVVATSLNLFILQEARADEVGVFIPAPDAAAAQPADVPSWSGRRPERWLSAESLRGLIAEAAEREGLHPALVRAVIKAGSYYNQYQVSQDGRLGLMQISPEMAKEMGVADVFDPKENIRVGTRRLRRLIDEFESVRLALAAYRESPDLVRNHDAGARPREETRRFVLSVLRIYRNDRLVYMQAK